MKDGNKLFFPISKWIIIFTKDRSHVSCFIQLTCYINYDIWNHKGYFVCLSMMKFSSASEFVNVFARKLEWHCSWGSLLAARGVFAIPTWVTWRARGGKTGIVWSLQFGAPTQWKKSPPQVGIPKRFSGRMCHPPSPKLINQSKSRSWITSPLPASQFSFCIVGETGWSKGWRALEDRQVFLKYLRTWQYESRKTHFCPVRASLSYFLCVFIWPPDVRSPRVWK